MQNIINVQCVERDCPVCDLNEFESLHNYLHNVEVRDGVFAFDVVEGICKNCGFIYTNPVPKEKFLEQYYHSKHLYDGGALDYNLENRITYLQKVKGERGRLLEIGSGEGSYVEAVKKLGIDAVGTEPNEQADSVSSHKYLEEHVKLFDLVVSNHVLEHIINPVKFISSLYDRMLPNGLIILEVPNLHMYGIYSTAISHEHISHFTPANLAYFVRKCGFEVLAFEYKEVSRPLGFTLLAQKNKNKIDSILPREYEVNRSYYLQSLLSIQKRQERYERHTSALTVALRPEQKLVFWGANTISVELCKLIPEEYYDKIVVVDANPNRWGTELSDEYPFNIYNPDHLRVLARTTVITVCAVSWAHEIRILLIDMGFTEQNIQIAPY
jgi:2-polyprenyl-3-methyl-5-hydroxy-6-metoxy-1,4-benzoquinol methylase